MVRRRGGPVIVIEDDEDTRAALRELLEYEGFDVFETPDGDAALVRLRAEPRPLVVLLDLGMPRKSGFDFYREQQGDPRTAGVPVIAVTAAPPSERRGLEDVPVVRKPIDPEELLFAIDRVTSGGE